MFISKCVSQFHARSRGAVALFAIAASMQLACGAAEVDPASPIADALKKANAGIERIVAVPEAQRTFDNTVGALDDVLVQFDIDTSMIQFMTHVSTDAAERERGGLAEEHYNNWLLQQLAHRTRQERWRLQGAAHCRRQEAQTRTRSQTIA
jgi:hypothetical protein